MSASPSIACNRQGLVAEERAASPCAPAIAAEASENAEDSDSDCNSRVSTPGGVEDGSFAAADPSLDWLAADATPHETAVEAQAAEPAAPVASLLRESFENCAGSDEATRFEDALLAMDAATVVSQKRMRETDIEGRRLRKPLGEPFPFHDKVAVLNAALQQVAVICGTEVPEDFCLQTDPKRVRTWVGQTVLAAQRSQFALGQAQERAHAAPRFAPATALEIMRCCTRMNELLSTHDPTQ